MGHGAETPPEAGDARRQTRLQSRMFLAIGAAVLVMALIYVRLSYEEAGSVMLVLAAALSFVCGGYLWLQVRKLPEGAREIVDDGMYLPHASIWPFWIGIAAFLLTNGLVLGVWFLVPGVVVLVFGLIGFVGQSRRRT